MTMKFASEAVGSRERSANYELNGWSNLDLITFVGLDKRTRPQDIYALHSLYPQIEFGILVGEVSGQANYKRYPDLEDGCPVA